LRGCVAGSIASGWDPVAGSCKDDNERSGYIYAGILLTNWATISSLRSALLCGVC